MPKAQMDKIGEIVEFIKGRSGGAGRFYPFQTLADAQKFLETGDTSLILTRLEQKGQPMPAEQIARIRETQAKETERLKVFQPLIDEITAKKAELASIPEVPANLKSRAWTKANSERRRQAQALEAEIGSLQAQLVAARMKPAEIPAKPFKPYRQPRAGRTEAETEARLAALQAKMTPEEKEDFQIIVKLEAEVPETLAVTAREPLVKEGVAEKVA